MSNTNRISKSVAAGALGGLIAAFAMNRFQSLLKAISGEPERASEDEDATIATAKAISQTLFHHELSEDEKKWAAPLVHYSLGASLGAVYGALAETVPAVTAGVGTAYGTAIWIGADEIAAPLLGMAKAPSEAPLSTHVGALASHLVFGVVTAVTRNLVLSA